MQLVDLIRARRDQNPAIGVPLALRTGPGTGCPLGVVALG
jgi:hypothetical protein